MTALPFILIKQPSNSQMALSNQVKESVKQASSHLREALAFAARSEHSFVINMLSDLVDKCESLESVEELMQRMHDTKASSYLKFPTNE
jgi:hypothetical protein